VWWAVSLMSPLSLVTASLASLLVIQEEEPELD